MIYAKKINGKQRAWLYAYERETTFEPLLQEALDSGEQLTNGPNGYLIQAEHMRDSYLAKKMGAVTLGSMVSAIYWNIWLMTRITIERW